MIAPSVLVLALAVQSAPAGSVGGTVIDAASRAPVPFAMVVLARVDGALTQSMAIRADALGRFHSAVVPPGAYRAFAEDPDYLRQEHGAPVTITAGQTIGDIAIALTRLGVVTGRVTTEHGDPAPAIHVRAWRGIDLVAETRTNDLGEYRLFGLAPGSYVVGAERYLGPTIGRTSPTTLGAGAAAALGGIDRYWVPTPPCPDCRGEGVGAVALSTLLNAGSFIDPRALTGRTYPPVYFSATTDRATATSIEVTPGAEVAGIDLRLIVR